MNSGERFGLPRFEEAEASLLGSFLREGALVRISSLDPADFYSERHRCVFEAMKQISNEGESVDIVTVKARLVRSKSLQVAGGDSFLMELADGCVSTSGWESWEKLIRDYSVKRQCIGVLREANEAAFEDNSSGADLVSTLQSLLNNVSIGRNGGSRMFSSVAGEWIANLGKPKRPPLSTGFSSLDQVLRIRPQQFGVVAARPGCGKTSWATQVALHVGQTQGEVLINALEMGEEELMLRITSQHTGISTVDIEDGNYSPQRDGTKIVNLQSALDVSFCFCQTPSEFRAEAFRRKAQGRLVLAITDYLQLMVPDRITGNDVSDLSQITRAHKLMAKELDIPVIGLSQFSRETMKAPAPKLHHLRGSGSIEQDADWVLFLYEETKEDDFFGAEQQYKIWELPKQRGGAHQEPWRMAWTGHCTKFSEFIA